MKTVFFSAGDVSGDLHAASLAAALRQRWPELRMTGMGGQAMAAAGVDVRVPGRDLAVGGLVELGGSARRIVRVWRQLTREVRELRPDLVVLVDSGAFNLPFARRAKRLTNAPLLYFVPPQAWAWRRGRARTMARRVDCVAAILPFEAEVYRRAGARVEFVGHPLVDRVRQLRARLDRKGARALLGLPNDRPVVALFPGSRRNELKSHLPLQLETARALHARDPRVEFELAAAPSLEDREFERIQRQVSLPESLVVRNRRDRSQELLMAADVALLKPGTATLEATLVGTPMVVMGRGHPLSAALVRRLVDIPFWAMPNLLADREIVPEFLQEQARPEPMAEALLDLLGAGGDDQRRQLAEAASRLGPAGAVDRVADLAETLVRERLAAT